MRHTQDTHVGVETKEKHLRKMHECRDQPHIQFYPQNDGEITFHTPTPPISHPPHPPWFQDFDHHENQLQEDIFKFYQSVKYFVVPLLEDRLKNHGRIMLRNFLLSIIKIFYGNLRNCPVLLIKFIFNLRQNP